MLFPENETPSPYPSNSEGSVLRNPQARGRRVLVVFCDGGGRAGGNPPFSSFSCASLFNSAVNSGMDTLPLPSLSNLCARASNSQSWSPARKSSRHDRNSSISSSPLLSRSKRVNSVFTLFDTLPPRSVIFSSKVASIQSRRCSLTCVWAAMLGCPARAAAATDGGKAVGSWVLGGRPAALA